MKISDALLPEFEQESSLTRTVLERCPEAKFQFKPHAKSWELIRLAGHLAALPNWSVMTLKTDSFDVMPAGGEPYRPVMPTTHAELLEQFDKNVATAKAAIAETSDEAFMKSWSLLRTGQPIFTLPRVVVVRTSVFNHSIFHRGQLTVYLRLLDVPVPAIYGPSADEGSF